MKRLILLTSLASALASAQPPKDRAEAELDLEARVKETREVCGYDLEAKIDWESFKSAFRDGHTSSAAAGYCGAILYGLRSACEEANVKAGLAKKISSVLCHYDKDAVKLKAELDGDQLGIHFGWDAGNLAEETKTWVVNAL